MHKTLPVVLTPEVINTAHNRLLVLAQEVAKPLGKVIGPCTVRVHHMPGPDPHLERHGLCFHLEIFDYPSVEK